LEVPAAHLGAVIQAAQGRLIVRTEQGADAEFIRAYAPLSLPRVKYRTSYQEFGAMPPAAGEVLGPERVLVATVWVSHKLNRILTKVVEAYDDYKELRINRRPLASTYLLTLAGVTLLIVFAAIWVGFFLARTLTEPIQELAEATQQVAKGNLSVQIPETGDDEISLLVKLFNTMISDLRETRDELVSGRKYMETVLESVDVGVMSVDVRRQISTCNTAALKILGISSASDVLGEPYMDTVPPALSGEIDGFFEKLVKESGPLTSNISVAVGEIAKHVQVSIAALVNPEGKTLGAVVLVDDFTELVKAQRMAAWREVARRIAHEIKNPLTPIQLNAQRLQRRLIGKGDEEGVPLDTEQARSLIGSCTDTIIDQVQVLRGLVNEFSRFARMPKTAPTKADLNELVISVGKMYREAHPTVEFDIVLDDQLPLLLIDREQMNRVLVNLMDNAVSSVQERFNDGTTSARVLFDDGESPQVKLETRHDSGVGVASLSISDNGVGISKSDRVRVFEPHFSTKKGGTGLGLAIVHSIVADHNGYLRIRDRSGAGVCFVIELPVPDVYSR
jgi:two-component system nitrogen regulation sensor histidine kinase NtrY